MLGIFDLISRHWEPFCGGIDGDVDNTIINDGMVYEDNLIFGTKDLAFATAKAGLYLYRGTDKMLLRMRRDQICSNGKAMLSSDAGLQLIDIDSPTRKVVRYPIDIHAAALGRPETVLDLTDDPAVPDGAILTPDQTGIIVSMFRPEAASHGETRWYDLATGALRCTWQTPGSPQNTCPALVAHQGKVVLVITTAVENMTEQDFADCPNAGRIFVGDTDFDRIEPTAEYPV
jgi:sugar lactone lactonase YvrE